MQQKRYLILKNYSRWQRVDINGQYMSDVKSLWSYVKELKFVALFKFSKLHTHNGPSLATAVRRGGLKTPLSTREMERLKH